MNKAYLRFFLSSAFLLMNACLLAASGCSVAHASQEPEQVEREKSVEVEATPELQSVQDEAEPLACSVWGQSCTSSSQCCSGLRCYTTNSGYKACCHGLDSLGFCI